MSGLLRLADAESVQDLGTYVARARRLDPEGAMRLQATGRVLAAWVCVLPGQGLMRSGLVLGLRTLPLAGEHDLDATVPLAALADRFARRAATGDVGTEVAVPPMTVAPAWAGVSPPRAGWQQVGAVAWPVLERAAQEGIAAVAAGVPDGAGAHAVEELRRRVWGRPAGATGTAAEVPAGAAFAAHGLGFGPAAAGAAVVLRSGPWWRLTLPTGHVLTR